MLYSELPQTLLSFCICLQAPTALLNKKKKKFPSTAFESAKKDFTLPSQEKGCLVYNNTFWIKAASAVIETKF